MPIFTNTSANPFGLTTSSTGTSTGSLGTGAITSNPFATPTSPAGGGTGGSPSGQIAGYGGLNPYTGFTPVGVCPPGQEWNGTACQAIGIYTPPNTGGNTNPLITRDDQVGYTNNNNTGTGTGTGNTDTPLITERGDTSSLLPYLNLGISGMRAATARGTGVRSPFKQGGGAGGAATDLEKFDNQLLAMGSEYLGKNVSGFAQGGKYNMYNQGGEYNMYNKGGMYDEYGTGGMYKKYNHGGGFYNESQKMKHAMMNQAMQSGIVAAQLDNVRSANNNKATARDLVGKMRNFARGGRF
tara:strand:+ start:1761 stop:2651 length:891 start_codon:yes stop_codon:yes gene_type:complete